VTPGERAAAFLLAAALVLSLPERVEDYGLSRKEWEEAIDQWIFDEISRHILKRKLLDNVTFEALAEEVNLSTVQTKDRFYTAWDELRRHI
jgi:AraC-like DNA-binding protein